MWDLVGNPEDRFSHDEAHMSCIMRNSVSGVGSILPAQIQMSLVVRKPVFGVSDQVPHKQGCAATEDG